MSWGRLFRLHAEARLEPHPDRPGYSRWIRGEEAVVLPTPVAALLAGLDGRRTLAAVAGEAVSAEALRGVVEVLVRQGIAEDLGPEPLLARDGLRHACAGCGMSCQGHFIGPLDADFLARSAAVHAAVVAERPELAAVQPLVSRTVQGRTMQGLAVLQDGACLYLDVRGCSVHRILGPEAKPDGCRLFPFELAASVEGARVAVSPGCARAHRVAADAPRSFTELSGLPVERLPPPPRRGGLAGGAAPIDAAERLLLQRLDEADPGERMAEALSWWCGAMGVEAAPPLESLLTRMPVRELGQELISEFGSTWSRGRPDGLWARQLRLARAMAFSELPARPLSPARDVWAATTLADQVWVRGFAPLGGLLPGVLWALLSATVANAASEGSELDDPFGERLALCVRLAASCPPVARLVGDPGLRRRVAEALARSC